MCSVIRRTLTELQKKDVNVIGINESSYLGEANDILFSIYSKNRMINEPDWNVALAVSIIASVTCIKVIKLMMNSFSMHTVESISNPQKDDCSKQYYLLRGVTTNFN